jgi:hypothetical protein
MTERAVRAALSKDYDVRAALTRDLLACGIPRSDIRHEITLDTSSSGGRADMVLLRDTAIIGIELKSGSDVLDRCDAQLGAMSKAFDECLVIVDVRIAGEKPSYKWLFYRHDLSQFSRDHQIDARWSRWVPFSIEWACGPYGSFKSRETSPRGMATLLWAAELSALAGPLRCRALDHIHENVPLKTVRPHVIQALRKRCLNRWEEAFWKRFDQAQQVAA